MMMSDWKNRIERANALWEKVDHLQEEINAIERALNEILQIEEEITSDEEGEQTFERKMYELFSQMLAELREREENAVKVPPERWKKIQTREILDLDRVSLDNLLELYRYFLSNKPPDRKIEIDDYFESLIDDRRQFINDFFNQRSGEWLRMDSMFTPNQDRRTVIATFLVLLDMVFRNFLKMKEEDGLVYLLNNEQ